jgi:hypothetical protein
MKMRYETKRCLNRESRTCRAIEVVETLERGNPIRCRTSPARAAVQEPRRRSREGDFLTVPRRVGRAPGAVGNSAELKSVKDASLFFLLFCPISSSLGNGRD